MTGSRHLGQRLRAARLAAGLTQEQLAERAGITDRTIRSIEAGATNPQQRIRNGIAQVLGVGVIEVHDQEADTASTARGRNLGDGTAAGKRSPAPSHTGA